MAKPEITGFGHIDLTVTNLEDSTRWWEEVMGFEVVHTTEREGFTVWAMLPGGLLGATSVNLVSHHERSMTKFDERTTGLDHLAFRVRDRAALQQWAEHFDALGVAHSGIQEEIGGPLIVLRDPDNIQLELAVFDPDLIGELVVNR
jgi:catechol 2,3-dioxygenase-like lactoylglutathione lyase family enzyme